ncbi:MAG: alpha/beta hydrolase [Chlamydiae bacterium]|nr:alpha/beta hydrolase [Chlamydiota bacterium]
MIPHHEITLKNKAEIGFVGPDAKAGPLPAIFYFALSKKESLKVDPYNEPVVHLKNFPLRIFSLDLPFHGANFSSVDAIKYWANEIEKGNNFIQKYIDMLISSIDELISMGLIATKKLGLMGLSRGGFIACHLAAKIPFISFIVAFAPLLKLTFSKEFQPIQTLPLAESLNIIHLAPQLYNKNLRFYISNRDTRVGTALSFEFITLLTETAFQYNIRSPQMELIISPPIGQMGHGTPNHIFAAGAEWIAQKLI